MFSSIVGWTTIVAGGFWLLKPEILKNRLKKKINRKMRRLILCALLVFGFSIMLSAMKLGGIVPKIIAIAGIIVVIKSIMMMMSKASDNIFNWYGKQPMIFFRIWAIVMVIIGISLIVL